MDVKFETAEDGIDPVRYIGDYFSHLSEKEISVLVGSIALLEEVDLSILQGVLNLEQMEVEEKIGRLMQTDLLDGHFTATHFVLDKFNYKIKKQHPNLTLDDRSMLAYLKARFEVSLQELEEAFDLSHASTIFVLSGYIAKGLITPHKKENNSYQFIVHFRYDKRGIDDITEFETQLVGYYQLIGKSSIKLMSEKMEEPEHKILSALTFLILSDMVIAKFEIDNRFFGGVELKIELDKFQVFFPRKSIQVLSNDERNFIGYLSLRQSATIEELASFLARSNTEIFKLAASLFSTNQLDIEYDTGIFKIVTFRPLSVNRSLDTLSKIHSFNYRVMMGLVQTQPRISVKEIASKMDLTELDVISGLISLYLEGLIDGKLDKKYIFHLKAIRSEDNQKDVSLERWESIILGALISENVISWPKITALLNTDRTTARNRGFEFISRGISKTVAKDTVLMLEEQPNLPPMVQISTLEPIERQILGYLKTHKNPQVNKIASRFELSKIEAFRLLYFLTGSGLFSLHREGNKLTLRNVASIEPQISVSELDLASQDVIRAIEAITDHPIHLNKIAKLVELSSSEVALHIYEIVAYGFYEGTLSGNRFYKEGQLYQTLDSGQCLYCAKELEAQSTTCQHCGRDLPQCGVCKGNLNSNQQLLACPHCKNLSHAGHIKQWLEIKGQCPFCRQRIQVNDLLLQQPML